MRMAFHAGVVLAQLWLDGVSGDSNHRLEVSDMLFARRELFWLIGSVAVSLRNYPRWYVCSFLFLLGANCTETIGKLSPTESCRI